MPEPVPQTEQAEAVVPEGVQRARAAFLRDFAKLIADRKTRGKFVCYHNDQLIAVNRDYVALIRELVARNIPENASVIFEVVPEAEAEERAFAEEAELP